MSASPAGARWATQRGARDKVPQLHTEEGAVRTRHLTPPGRAYCVRRSRALHVSVVPGCITWRCACPLKIIMACDISKREITVERLPEAPKAAGQRGIAAPKAIGSSPLSVWKMDGDRRSVQHCGLGRSVRPVLRRNIPAMNPNAATLRSDPTIPDQSSSRTPPMASTAASSAGITS